MTIGEKIVKLRKQAGYSQETFSEKLGISRQAVSKWENGTAQPTNENLAQISRLFGVPVSALLDDGDVNINQAVADAAPKEEFITEKKKNYVTNVMHSGAIIVLAIAVMVQGTTIGSLKTEIEYIKSFVHRITSAENEISSLRNYVYSLPAALTENSKDFTDYHYENVSYDFDTNTAVLKFSVVPTDYSRQTQAKIVIKGSTQTYSVDAVQENDIFTATVQVECEDNMAVYLYLTDNGQTRSFILDYLSNPADAYRLVLSEGSYEGEVTAGKGELKLDGNYNIKVNYSAARESALSVFPVKAVLQIYADGNLIKEIPHTNVMEYDYEADGRINLGRTTEERAAGWVAFGMSLREVEIIDSRLTDTSKISLVILVHDNNGREYSHTTEIFI